MARHVVEVASAPGFADPRAGWVRSRCEELGLRVDRVETARLFRIEGAYRPKDARAAAEKLLADPVTERFQVFDGNKAVPGARSGAVTIDVWYLPQVTDPAADSVEKALQDLGLPEPERVRCGQRTVVTGQLSRDHAEKLAEKALANPVVQEFRIAR